MNANAHTPHQAPAWFHNAVLTGVQWLFALKLENTPAAEVLPLTAQSLIDVLWHAPIAWREPHDAQRLQAMFMSAGRACTRWPAPATLLVHLPAYSGPTALPAPKPQRSVEAQAKVQAQIAKFKALGLVPRKPLPPTEDNHATN